MLEQMFALRTRGVTVGTEVLAGATTFMVMAYIIFVNPAILSFAGVPGLTGQGPGFAPTLAATCLVAGVMTAQQLSLRHAGNLTRARVALGSAPQATNRGAGG